MSEHSRNRRSSGRSRRDALAECLGHFGDLTDRRDSSDPVFEDYLETWGFPACDEEIMSNLSF